MMSKPNATPYQTLPAAQVADPNTPLAWLLADLVLVGGVGVVGAAPKTGKSFFALELAVAVASGTAALGRFAVPTAGTVLLCAAEDPPAVVVRRLAALAAARQRTLDSLPLQVIVEAGVQFPRGFDRLTATLAACKPRLLLLDPLIRFHSRDENSAAEMAVVLDGLRRLARTTGCAILLCHHTRKAPAGAAAGLGLRGSSDVHAFGDVNLYLRRLSTGLLDLRIEHRAIASPPPLRVRLTAGEPLVCATYRCEDIPVRDPLRDRLLRLIGDATAPISTTALRSALGIRNQTLLTLLHELVTEELVQRVGREGWAASRRSKCFRSVSGTTIPGETEASSVGIQLAEG
jgi:hypothetical protein